jgi:mono/diheme cytochrome c family protein
MRVARLTALTASVVVLAAFVGALMVYLSNRDLLDRRYPVGRIVISASKGIDAVARGKHLADIVGCTDCHGADLRGRLFIDEGWLYGRYYAANLTLKAVAWSDADLARVVRDGVRPDGRGVVIMPAFAYGHITDTELGDILAFIRAMPAGGSVQPEHWTGPLDQWALWMGRLKPAIAYVAIERGKAPPEVGPQHAFARHIVAIACVECHGGDLKGNGWDSGAPDLAVAAAYSLERFTRLLRTGVGADGKEHGLMSRVSRERLRTLVDEEIAGIHAYLLSRAEGGR